MEVPEGFVHQKAHIFGPSSEASEASEVRMGHRLVDVFSPRPLTGVGKWFDMPRPFLIDAATASPEETAAWLDQINRPDYFGSPVAS